MPQFGEIVHIEDNGVQSETTGIWLSSTPDLVLKDTGEITNPEAHVTGLEIAAPFNNLGQTIAQRLSQDLQGVDTKSISEMGKQVADWIRDNVNSSFDSLQDVVVAALEDVAANYPVLMSADLIELAKEIVMVLLQGL